MKVRVTLGSNRLGGSCWQQSGGGLAAVSWTGQKLNVAGERTSALLA